VHFLCVVQTGKMMRSQRPTLPPLPPQGGKTRELVRLVCVGEHARVRVCVRAVTEPCRADYHQSGHCSQPNEPAIGQCCNVEMRTINSVIKVRLTLWLDGCMPSLTLGRGGTGGGRSAMMLHQQKGHTHTHMRARTHTQTHTHTHTHTHTQPRLIKLGFRSYHEQRSVSVEWGFEMGPPPGFTAVAAAMGLDGSEEMAAQAAQLWEMMDDLAKNDPVGFVKCHPQNINSSLTLSHHNRPKPWLAAHKHMRDQPGLFSSFHLCIAGTKDSSQSR
jgi:hypothetical protein